LIVEVDSKLARARAEDVDDEPLATAYGSDGEFGLVGNGKVTDNFCGVWESFQGCLRVDLHDLVTLEGKNHKGKVFVHKVHHYCSSPSCPICYRNGWAVKEARRIEARLMEASKHFGQIEHIVASVPLKDYGLKYATCRLKTVKALAVRGVLGGVLIFHAFRFNNAEEAAQKGTFEGWYWSPHYHCIGFISGGYGKCRHCGIYPSVVNCRGCGGFEDRTREAYPDDGYIVKVAEDEFGHKDVRKTIFGTALYQLRHASVKKGVKRFHVATYFGVCSYRKLKVTVEKRKVLCPICQHDCIRMRYDGLREIVVDRSSVGYVRDSFEDLVEGGEVVWSEAPEPSFHRPSLGGKPVECRVEHGEIC